MKQLFIRVLLTCFISSPALARIQCMASANEINIKDCEFGYQYNFMSGSLFLAGCLLQVQEDQNGKTYLLNAFVNQYTQVLTIRYELQGGGYEYDQSTVMNDKGTFQISTKMPNETSVICSGTLEINNKL